MGFGKDTQLTDLFFDVFGKLLQFAEGPGPKSIGLGVGFGGLYGRIGHDRMFKSTNILL